MDVGEAIKMAEFLREAIEKIVKTFINKSGVVNVCGRDIRYESKIKVHNLKVVWYCKVVDLKTNIRARADNFKGEKGARKHAVQNLANKLADAGIITRV